MNFLEGVGVSIGSMLIVFLILVLLAMVISLFRFLPADKEEARKKKVKPSAGPAGLKASGSSAASGAGNDDEERMVAMLTAACLAKEAYKGHVRIVSCERVK